MDNQRLIEVRIQEHLQSISLLQTNKELLEELSQISAIIIECFQNGGKVYFCGNGGSAADAQHLAAEFSGRFYIDRRGLPAEALHCNTSYLTAVANDYSYDVIYSRLIAGMGCKGDILIGISTSGNSQNIINAFEVCKEKGVSTIALTGHSGGKMGEMADYSLIVPSDDTPRIQEAHIMLGHIICEIVEAAIFDN
ncbi:D-sedoheptulose 7-phosphate isomerase [Bacteroides sp. OM08-17BH]|uniref:D-sedoheptulose 7-phosphate isomerase n=1 Tax=Bacteroides TaxID=816 RepID=UPI000E43D734|nr:MULTISPECIES: D-sedoheptulose 7-phosphate isomerase [unclassified Bacteroides]MBS7574000.1 D-sedoheptulose 7-phosphate isomerase [Bacteroides propionicigenes]RGM27796.1 D-sedoheptulose 7-phosphate isomerase [Bacteroides sp. OM08-17BH]HBO06462.1 D-sedoheptulose 7-phosphate isomerase [Bacteroides sp.]